MKKMLTAIVALIFTAGIINAQDAPARQNDVAVPQPTPVLSSDADNAQKAEMTAADCDMKNCCTMRNGKMFRLKDGKESPMTTDMKLANGSALLRDGTIMRADGSKSKLKEGQCMDTNGNLGRMPQPAKSAAPAKKAAATPSDKTKK